MLASMDIFNFRFFINALMASHSFTSAESQMPITQFRSELDNGITYYSYATEAIPLLDFEDMFIWNILTLLDEVLIFSNRAIPWLNSPT
ncbi:hypothetical protein DSO57_1023236 [Entomophthora muscae]|uniref:Uncharacterized protein n=1 Tax=Entomophthora muscae TaxID=34485 RepID=A0ACC2UNM2_9FUNG|nr:hypothetical protein DSO57_1023236 [Entomophthora muscae]